MKMMPDWLDTVAPFESGAAGGPQGDYDVAVVGAGFAGLSPALALARKGAKVVVLEADRVAGAASGRKWISTRGAISTGRPSPANSARRGSRRSSASITAIRNS